MLLLELNCLVKILEDKLGKEGGNWVVEGFEYHANKCGLTYI